MDCTPAGSRIKAYSRYRCDLALGPCTDRVRQPEQNRNLHEKKEGLIVTPTYLKEQ